jgi:hypothetical protein
VQTAAVQAGLRVQEGGRGEPLLVLLHGLGATGDVWAGWRPLLARRWPGRWLAPDEDLARARAVAGRPVAWFASGDEAAARYLRVSGLAGPQSAGDPAVDPGLREQDERSSRSKPKSGASTG